jgi:ankyrin repeat protein
MKTKPICLRAIFTVFLFICAFGVRGQESNKADKLMNALLNNDCAKAVKLSESLKSPNYTDIEGNSLLYYAISSDCIEVVKILLDKGADINQKLGENRSTPLIEEITKGNIDVFKLLLERGADVNGQTNGITPLMVAILKDNNEMAKLLIEYGANVDLKSTTGETALLIASGKGNVDLVSLLIEKGANVNIQNLDGYSALMVASIAGKTDIVKLLIQNGANLELETPELGETALTLATANDKTEVVKLLLENGAVEPKLILIPEEEITALKIQLIRMSNPFSLNYLFNMVMSTGVNSYKVETKLNSISGRWAVCLAKENKVDVISLKKSFDVVEFMTGNDVSIEWFRTDPRCFFPQRLCTLYYPTDNVLTGVLFSRIIIWYDYENIKDIYTFINGKWFRRVSG